MTQEWVEKFRQCHAAFEGVFIRRKSDGDTSAACRDNEEVHRDMDDRAQMIFAFADRAMGKGVRLNQDGWWRFRAAVRMYSVIYECERKETTVALPDLPSVPPMPEGGV